MLKAKVYEEVKLARATVLEIDRTVLGLSKMIQGVRGQVIYPEDVSYQETYTSRLQLFQEASQALDGLVQVPQQQERLDVILVEKD
jgi:hypothetical protein